MCFPEAVVHSQVERGFEVTEQLTYNCPVSFTVVLLDALKVGMSISRKTSYKDQIDATKNLVGRQHLEDYCSELKFYT